MFPDPKQNMAKTYMQMLFGTAPKSVVVGRVSFLLEGGKLVNLES